MRHTMGQDWGGRRKVNPDGCPVITSKMVLAKADELGIEMLRGEPSTSPGGGFIPSLGGMWWICGDKLISAGATNYFALETLRRIERLLEDD